MPALWFIPGPDFPSWLSPIAACSARGTAPPPAPPAPRHSPQTAAHLLTVGRLHTRLQGMHWQTRVSQYCWSVQLFMASHPTCGPSMAAEREVSRYGVALQPPRPFARAGTLRRGMPRCAPALSGPGLGQEHSAKPASGLASSSNYNPTGEWPVLVPGDMQGGHPGLQVSLCRALQGWGCTQLPAGVRLGGTAPAFTCLPENNGNTNRNDHRQRLPE